MPRALIFANGDFSHPSVIKSMLRTDDVVIAADGGARHALAAGVLPSVIIGDLDSLTEVEVRDFSNLGVRILRYPPAKDETDLELALSHALKAGYNPVIIFGAFGGRLDQSLHVERHGRLLARVQRTPGEDGHVAAAEEHGGQGLGGRVPGDVRSVAAHGHGPAAAGGGVTATAVQAVQIAALGLARKSP